MLPQISTHSSFESFYWTFSFLFFLVEKFIGLCSLLLIVWEFICQHQHFFFLGTFLFFPFVSDKKPFILHLMWNNSVTWLRVAFSYIWTNEWMNEQSPESFQKKIQDFFYFLFTNLCCFSFFLVLSQSSWSNEA